MVRFVLPPQPVDAEKTILASMMPVWLIENMLAVTLADLTDQDVPLLIGCLNCGRHVYRSAVSLPLSQLISVPKLASRLRCSGCGARNTQKAGHMTATCKDRRQLK